MSNAVENDTVYFASLGWSPLTHLASSGGTGFRLYHLPLMTRALSTKMLGGPLALGMGAIILGWEGGLAVILGRKGAYRAPLTQWRLCHRPELPERPLLLWWHNQQPGANRPERGGLAKIHGFRRVVGRDAARSEPRCRVLSDVIDRFVLCISWTATFPVRGNATAGFAQFRDPTEPSIFLALLAVLGRIVGMGDVPGAQALQRLSRDR
jgi:hypothetical protein